MQKVINVIALLSGLVSLATLGTTFYIYKHQDVLVEDARKQIAKEIAGVVSELLPVPSAPTSLSPNRVNPF